MSMDELKAKILEEFKEEMDGAVKYHKMALAAEELGRSMDYVNLMCIAKDEMSHSWMLHEWLHDHAVDIPEDVEKKYRELEASHK